MSRTRKGSKGPGYEWWGRRPLAGYSGTGKDKRLCHGIERAHERAELREELDAMPRDASEEHFLADEQYLAEAAWAVEDES